MLLPDASPPLLVSAYILLHAAVGYKILLYFSRHLHAQPG
jgi:hypothetical protein